MAIQNRTGPVRAAGPVLPQNLILCASLAAVVWMAPIGYLFARQADCSADAPADAPNPTDSDQAGLEKNRDTAAVLGKALLWAMQVGTDSIPADAGPP